jgi:zinc protease
MKERRLLLVPLLLVLTLASCITQVESGRTDTTVVEAEVRPTTAESGSRPDATPTPTSPEELDRLPVDPAVTVGVLDNGLRYYIRRNAEPQGRAFLRLAVNVGSILEDEDQLGLAHFTEHMAFNGTASYSGNEIIAFLERLGMQWGPDVNAYTGFDQTVYELTVPTDDELFREGFAVLYEWAAAMQLSEEEIDRERGVIIEEWRYRRSADARMREQQYPVLFADSRYAHRLPIGDIELIANFPPDALRRFYADWYRPDLMSVIAVGDFDPGRVEDLIHELFSGFHGPEQPRDRTVYQVPGHDETRFVVASDPEAAYTQVSLVIKRDAEALNGLQDYRGLLVDGLFADMLNDRLDEISRSSAAPFLGAAVSSGRLVRTESAASLSAVVEGNAVAPALEALTVEMRRVSELGFTATELERAKQDRMRWIEQIYRERENINSESFADEYVRAFLEDEAIPGIPMERDLHEQILPEITLDEVNALAAEYLRPENRVIMVSAVESPDLPPVSVEELQEAFQAALTAPLTAYQDVVVDSALLASLPDAGMIISRIELDAEGVLDWRLSNGVRVLVMPTDYRADQILFSAWSDGGTSVATAGDFRSAQYSTAFVEQMGYGSFSPPDLERALSGAAVSVTPYVDLLSEGLSGSASVDDLQTLFELIHLKMTAPRTDQEAFLALKRQFQTVVANQENQPNYRFSRLLQEQYSLGHPRTMPIDQTGVDSIDLETVLSFYRDRFGDASDFTFLFVGNIDVDGFAPLLERYLGSLPATRRRDSWVDPRIDRPQGVVVDSVRIGMDPVSQVAVVFHGPYNFSQSNNYDIRALERLLEIRMQEVIREEESGTYGVGVQAQFARRPDPRYSILVTFGADPDRVDQLTASLFQVVEELQTTIASEEYVQRIRETQRADFEEGLTSNQFWLSQVEYAISNNRPVSAIRRYLDLVDQLTPEEIQRSAQRYLDLDRYVQVTLYPGGVNE